MSCEDIIEVMRVMYQKGMITVLSGNASMRISDKLFCITPSSVPKHKISQLALVDLDTLNWSGPKPSIEYRMHALIYKNTDAKAVVHAHSPWTVLAAELGLELDPQRYVESKYAIRNVAKVPPLEAGSWDLARAVAEKAREADAIILEGHGAIAYGKDPWDTLNKLEALEYLAKLEVLKRGRD